MKEAKEQQIRKLVQEHISTYADGFRDRHVGEVGDPDGVINMKIHNIFVEALGEETRFYGALVRSLDSSLGNRLEKLAIEIAKITFTVKQDVEGEIWSDQTTGIVALLESYKSRTKTPAISDYQFLRSAPSTGASSNKRHDSDYYLIDPKTNDHALIELKIGGDLDNKKARSEKEALLEQFAILSGTLPGGAKIKIYFATAYNRYGEGEPWNQSRVKQYFADDELLIGADFWNFVTQSQSGYDVVLSEYKNSAHFISDALTNIREAYLANGN